MGLNALALSGRQLPAGLLGSSQHGAFLKSQNIPVNHFENVSDSEVRLTPNSNLGIITGKKTKQ